MTEPSAVCSSTMATTPRILPGSPYHTVALVFTILFPIFVILQLAVVVWYRNYSVFIRKRSLPLIFQVAFGAMLTWGYTVLYDYLGSHMYPCWLFQFLNYFATPIMSSAILLQTFQYITQIAVRIMSRELAENQELRRLISSSVELHEITGKASLQTFLAHIWLVLKLPARKEDRLKTRLLNLQFVKTRWFAAIWLFVAFIPSSVAFVARLATDPQWRECNGCELNTFDASFGLVLFIIGVSIGERGHTTRVTKVDALRIVREAKYCWRTGSLAAVSFILYLIDPGGLYASGMFNWRFIFFLAPALLLYTKTTHQVIMARFLKRRVLTSTFIAREDRFADVMLNKELKKAFRKHLDSELSSEIYNFLDAVDDYKAQFDKVEKQTSANFCRHILETYIEKRSPYEVNISSSARERIIDQCTVDFNHIEVNCFDLAYDEIKHNLLNDGFARFLSKLDEDEKERKFRRTTRGKGLVEHSTSERRLTTKSKHETQLASPSGNLPTESALAKQNDSAV